MNVSQKIKKIDADIEKKTLLHNLFITIIVELANVSNFLQHKNRMSFSQRRQLENVKHTSQVVTAQSCWVYYFWVFRLYKKDLLLWQVSSTHPAGPAWRPSTAKKCYSNHHGTTTTTPEHANILPSFFCVVCKIDRTIFFSRVFQ